MCGIAAIVSYQAVNQELYDALTVLQHRGRSSGRPNTSNAHGEGAAAPANAIKASAAKS